MQAWLPKAIVRAATLPGTASYATISASYGSSATLNKSTKTVKLPKTKSLSARTAASYAASLSKVSRSLSWVRMALTELVGHASI